MRHFFILYIIIFNISEFIMNTDNLLKNKLLDLANRSFKQNIFTFSSFLSLPEISIFHEIEKELQFCPYTLYGGYEDAERLMIKFGSSLELGYDEEFPIDVLEIKPLIDKFSEQLSHRDYLGALMNLGIKRELLGDIIIKDKYAYLLCANHISDFITNNLGTIKHTHIQVNKISANYLESSKTLESVEVISASARVDAAVASLTKLSRSNALTLFTSKKIFLNGKQLENNSYNLKPEDILVIRGYGKYIYKESGNETKKGRVYLHFEKYV